MALMAIGLESSRTCIVSNISDEVDETALRGFLGNFGTVQELTRMEGMGVEAQWKVLYGNESDAKDALLVHGMILCGLPVHIKPIASQDDLPPTITPDPEQPPTSTALALPSGIPGGVVDPITQAAFAAAQQAGIQTDQIPGAGITPQLLDVVRAQPELANSLIPLLKAHSNSSAAELGLLTRITEFHKDRAKIDAEKKHEQEKEQLRRELEELKRNQKERESERQKKKRRSSSYSSESSRGDRRRRKDESMTPPPPSADKKGTFNLHESHISPTPTKHLYIVFPLGAKLPTLKGVKPYFDTIGTLTELKISKSLSSVFASFSNIDTVPDSAISTLKEKVEFEGAQFYHANTSFKVYQDNQQRNEKSRESERRRRRESDRKSYDRRDRTPPRRRRRSTTPDRRRRRR